MPLNVTGGALEFDAIVNDSQFGATIKLIEKRLESLTATAEKETKAIEGLVKTAVQGLAGYVSLAAGTDFIRDIVRVRGEFQQLEVAFSTMLGSKVEADKLMARVTEFASTTPFELSEVAAATKQLLAFGIAAADIPKTLKAIGDVSAGIGAPLGEIAYLYGTIKTAGRAEREDIKQFAQRGIPVYEELAKILGVSVEKVNEFVSAGKVGFPEIQKVFENLTAEGAKFGNLMEAQSKTLVGQISNLRDAFDQMLNEIGKGQEGLFSDAISTVSFIVENYKKIIDILEVLILTYGSYRAAIIATNVVNAISIAMTKGYTVAELLRYNAMLLSEKAMKLLNATMLKNPAAWVVAGITALVSSLIIFRKETDKAKTAADYLAQAQKDLGDKLSAQEAKIRPYVDALKNANLSEQERVNIYNELKKIDPQIVSGIDAKKISYENLTANVNKYLAALRNQYKLEANREAVLASIQDEEKIKKRIADFEKQRDQQIAIQDRNREALQKRNDRAAREQLALQNQYRQNIQDNFRLGTEELYKQLAQQQKITQELGETQITQSKEQTKEQKRSLEVIDEAIKAKKKEQEQNSTTATEYQKYQREINALEEEKKRIIGATKSDIKSQQSADEKALALLEKRKDLLAEIADRVAESQETNRTKEQSELDKINDKYDKLIENIDEYNKKVDAFNKKNPNSNVQKVGQADIVELNNARAQELDNTRLKAQADLFQKNLEKQRVMFEQYEEAKKQVGEEKAKELFADQLKEYKSYLELLQTESTKLAPKIQFGIANVGEEQKFKALVDAYKAYSDKKNQESVEEQKRQFIDLLSASATYNQQRAAINKKYDELEATLRKNSTIQEFDERSKILKQKRQEEISDLEGVILRSSELYKKLNQDILGFTRKRIKDEIELLKARLKNDSSLTPQMKADIQAVIDQYQGLLDETNEISKKYNKIAARLSSISGSFSTLADGVEGLNSQLADGLRLMSDLTSIASNAGQAIASFATGTPEGILSGISSSVNVLVGLFSIGSKAREQRRRQQEEIKDFMAQQFIGEQQINILYQERARELVKINKLRIEGLQAERDLLLQQKNDIAAQYQTVFDALQKESYKRIVNLRDIFGNTILTQVMGETAIVSQSLFGKTYDEIEKLFLSGQLEGRAKDLFETLKQIKESGVDIDKLLAENTAAAREIFTGTTADNIVDSIADGFANGLRSASDFADNFEDLMRKAIINSLKYKYLEGPLQEFYKQFAEASESGGQLTQAEIDQLQQFYNSIITNAQAQFDQLQQISGVNLTGSGTGVNTLTGAIKGMTEQQAELLAGQFGGLRITAMEQLNLMRSQLDAINAIQINTSQTVLRMNSLLNKFDAYETGAKTINVKVQ